MEYRGVEYRVFPGQRARHLEMDGAPNHSQAKIGPNWHRKAI